MLKCIAIQLGLLAVKELLVKKKTSVIHFALIVRFIWRYGIVVGMYVLYVLLMLY